MFFPRRRPYPYRYFCNVSFRFAIQIEKKVAHDKRKVHIRRHNEPVAETLFSRVANFCASFGNMYMKNDGCAEM